MAYVRYVQALSDLYAWARSRHRYGQWTYTEDRHGRSYGVLVADSEVIVTHRGHLILIYDRLAKRVEHVEGTTHYHRDALNSLMHYNLQSEDRFQYAKGRITLIVPNSNEEAVRFLRHERELYS